MTVQALEKRIRKAAKEYYAGEPTISDYQYDLLVEELRKKKPKSKVLRTVGAVPMGSTGKHKIPMGSLKKADDEKALEKWWKGISQVIAMPKIDGASCSIEYKKGKLVRALTRGDGTIGEDITVNVMRMQNVKHMLHISATGSLRGEIVMSGETFAEKYADGYSNPRNTAVGIARRHSGEGCEDLKVLYFDVLFYDPDLMHTRQEMLANIQRLGLETVSVVGLFKSVEAFRSQFAYMIETRFEQEFEMDGAVLSVNRYSEREAGDPKFPADQIAYKFPPEMAETYVTDITWEAARTGRVNPVVHVKPVQVAGVKVKKATGNNLPWMRGMGIGVGAAVEISRRGDVIPAVERVVKRKSIVVAPKVCPSCDSPLRKDGAYLRCLNSKCPEKVHGTLQYWLRLVNVKGIGSSSLRDLILEYYLRVPADFYTLTETEYEDVMGKNGRKVYKELHAKKAVGLEQVFAAHIPNVGTRRFKALMQAGYGTPEALLALTTADVGACDGFGEHLAGTVVQGIKEATRAIQALLKYVTLKDKSRPKGGGGLVGYGLKFTGKMTHSRSFLEERAQEYGAHIGWNKSLKNVLVIADPNSNSGKAKKAREKGYEIWSPEEFSKRAK